MPTHTHQSYEERILKVLIYIQNNLDGNLSLEKLSEVACFSPYHFHRIFTAYKNESLKTYIRRLRLNRAVSDLTYTDMPIIQVAERAGYDAQQSFHRAFKETYHATPSSFRTQEQKKQAAILSSQEMNVLSQPKNLSQHEVEIVTLAPMPVYFVRHNGDYKEGYRAWFQLLNEVGMQHLASADTQKIGIAHDVPDFTPIDKRRYDACVTLGDIKNPQPKGKLGIQTIHGGRYACITHSGSLVDIEKTYLYLFGVWLPQSNYEPDDHPNFMLHKNSPFDTPDEELITKIYLPIK